jgi:hypothetical protein
VSLPTVLYLAPAALCVVAWLGPTVALPRRVFAGQGLLLETLTRLGLGGTALALLTFVLGLAGAFDRGVLIGITVALAIPGLWVAAGLARRVRRTRHETLVVVLLVAVAIALLLTLVAASAPPTSADALKYHLGAPQWWLHIGRIDEPFWDWHAFGPSATEMLYAHGLALGGGETAGAIGALIGVLASLAVFGLARELGAGDVRAGAFGIALFVLQGIFTWEATSAFVELNLTFLTTLAAWYAVRREPLYAGLFFGAAAGTKYLGLPAVLIVAAPLFVVARRRLVPIAWGAVLAVAVGAAWYVRDAVAAHNPVYPLLFGGKWWTPYVESQFQQIDREFGVRGTVLKLPILPLELLLHGHSFDRGQYVGTAVFVLAPLGFWAARRRETVALLIGTVGFLIAWWYLSEQARFLFPALAILSAAAGAGAAALWKRRPWTRRPLLAILAVAAGIWLVASVALTRQLIPVTVGAESRGAFLQRLTGTYRAFQAVARRKPGTVGLVGYPFAFNFPGRAIQLDNPAFTPYVARAEYVRRMRNLGVRDVLVAGDPGQVAVLRPIRGCLDRLAEYHARYVTSRSLGHSTPLLLTLYSTRRC